MHPECDFFNFSSIFGRPSPPPNRAKIAKNRKKRRKNRSRKNIRFSTPFFLDFPSFLPPKTTPKSNLYRYFFENADFVKIIVFPKENCYFLRSGPPKNHPKSMPRRIRKKHRKVTPKKSVLASILASQNLSKSLQNLEKSLHKATGNEACFATLWKSRANRRKLTGIGVCKASKGLRIWLGLLYLSILGALTLGQRIKRDLASHGKNRGSRAGEHEQPNKGRKRKRHFSFLALCWSNSVARAKTRRTKM